MHDHLGRAQAEDRMKQRLTGSAGEQPTSLVVWLTGHSAAQVETVPGFTVRPV